MWTLGLRYFSTCRVLHQRAMPQGGQRQVEARHTLFSIDGMYPAIIVTRLYAGTPMRDATKVPTSLVWLGSRASLHIDAKTLHTGHTKR